MRGNVDVGFMGGAQIDNMATSMPQSSWIRYPKVRLPPGVHRDCGGADRVHHDAAPEASLPEKWNYDIG